MCCCVHVQVRLPMVHFGTKPKNIGLKEGGCPPGTVPILRVNTREPGEPIPPPPPAPQEHCVRI